MNRLSQVMAMAVGLQTDIQFFDYSASSTRRRGLELKYGSDRELDLYLEHVFGSGTGLHRF